MSNKQEPREAWLHRNLRFVAGRDVLLPSVKGYKNAFASNRVFLRFPMLTSLEFIRPFDHSKVTMRLFDQSTLTGDFATATGVVSVKHGWLVGGKAEGVEAVVVDTGTVRALLLPTRGMAIWKLWAINHSETTEFGWTSPVDGPVHPAFVPVMDPGGLGWLEGFDELLVRCGLESNGAPEKDESGTLKYPLHGRVGNLPARDLRVSVDHETGRVEIVGDIVESRLFFSRLRLRSRTSFVAGSSEVHVVDEVTNERSVPATMQLLYHINIGDPILSSGASVDVPLQTLAPKDSLSAGEIDGWNRIHGPELGYCERVYFAQPSTDASGWTTVLLRGANDQYGMGVRFDTTTLPYFILWKNTAATNDGYVIGLEPATNLPNGRSFEATQGRVVSLGAGETKAFQLSLHPIVDRSMAQQFAAAIDSLSKTSSGQGKPTVYREPKTGWSVGA